jgi:hypothetical protein
VLHFVKCAAICISRGKEVILDAFLSTIAHGHHTIINTTCIMSACPWMFDCDK